MIRPSMDKFEMRKPRYSILKTLSSRPSTKSRSSKPSTPAGSSSHLERSDIPTITWDDFSAKPDTKSPWAAHTFWDVSYKYKINFAKSSTHVQMCVNCRLNSSTSWVKQREDRLLAHERGHYLIGWICALDFKKRVNQAKLSKNNYPSEIQKIFQETLDEYLKWEILYDEETDHYKNIVSQQKWDLAIARKLEQLRSYIQ